MNLTQKRFNVQGEDLGFLTLLTKFYSLRQRWNVQKMTKVYAFVLTEQTSNCAIGLESETVASSECEKEKEKPTQHTILSKKIHIKVVTWRHILIVYRVSYINTRSSLRQKQHLKHRYACNTLGLLLYTIQSSSDVCTNERTKAKCVIERERMIKAE